MYAIHSDSGSGASGSVVKYSLWWHRFKFDARSRWIF